MHFIQIGLCYFADTSTIILGQRDIPKNNIKFYKPYYNIQSEYAIKPILYRVHALPG